MTLKMTLGALALASTLASAGAVHADDYEIDSQHAWVSFTIKHGIYAVAHGQFDSVAGEITFDKDDVTKSSVRAQIAVDSIHTALEQRDADLKGPDFFNAAEFPDITFESTSVAKVDETTGKVTGNLTIGGMSKEITLDVTLVNEAVAPWDANLTKAAFHATGTISTEDFPMAKNAAAFGLGPQVDIVIDIEATKK